MPVIAEPAKVIAGSGKNTKYVKDCTELRLSGKGLQRLRGFESFVNVEVLWLNDNNLQYINNLDANFRIKELYAFNNSICTLKGSLRCFKFLTTLDLSNNQLCDLDKLIQTLSRFLFLKTLNLTGNPCCQEADYRLKLINAVPSLHVLDQHVIRNEERWKAKVQIGGYKADGRIVFFCAAPKPDPGANAKVSEASYHEKVALRENKAIRAREIADAEHAEKQLYSFDPYPPVQRAARPPPPPGWRADWSATQRFGGTVPRPHHAGQGAVAVVRKPPAKDAPEPLVDIKAMPVHDVLQHSTYRCQDTYSFYANESTPLTWKKPAPGTEPFTLETGQYDAFMKQKALRGPWTLKQYRVVM